MEGIDADARIGITVCPRVRAGGVVDGQNLQQPLSGECHPVHHLLQVAEVAHAETGLAAQGEHGNHRTCQSLIGNGEESLRQFIDHHVAHSERRKTDGAIVLHLPDGRDILALANHHELEHEGV